MASSLNNNSTSLTIDSSHVLRLIQSHLTQNSLHESCRTLREESGVGAAGACHLNYRTWAKAGQWGSILDNISGIDQKYIPKDLLADVHEMAVLELAQVGELELSYATLRLIQADMDEWTASPNALSEPENSIPRSRVLEQRLAALVALRGNTKDASIIPPDYYGRSTRQERREEIGTRLSESIPVVPASRLTTLLQQAIKWQAHTGQVPYVKYTEDDDESQPKKKRKRKEFDLVLGEVRVRSAVVGDAMTDDAASEPIPSKPYSSIRFGKKATAECALFLSDGSGLVTGSSDGLVEVWDPAHKYTKLRMDLPYQRNEEFLFHDSAILALAISNDGTLLATGSTDGVIKVWRVDTSGQCLRELQAAHEKAVSCLAFSNDASHILSGSHDFTCREFGLRTSRLLKEFRGHTSYVNSCNYVLPTDQDDGSLLVVTGSADGTVRIWDGKTSEIQHVFQPHSMVETGSSILVNHSTLSGSNEGTTNIHTVLVLHTPRNTMLVVPRGPRAFLVNYSGTVLKIYEENTTKDFVAATTSPSNRWLYAVREDGVCLVFDVCSGKLQQNLRNFGSESTGSSRGGSNVEISGMVHHPHRGILGGFSNDKGQKRGVLTLWK